MEALYDPQFTEQFWGWAGRAASVAQILSVPLVAAALFIAWRQLGTAIYEQRRLLNELGRKPDFKLSLGVEDEPELRRTFTVNQNPSALSRSQSLVVPVYVTNTGTRSATYLLANFTLPPGISNPHAGLGRVEYLSDTDGTLRGIFHSQIPLHPTVSERIELLLEVPYQTRTYELAVTVLCTEAVPFEGRLLLDIEPGVGK